MKNNPPKLPLRFFRWFCNPDCAEDIEGDLFEKFEGRIEERGLKFAKWKFYLDVLLLFRPGIIRSLSEGQNINQLDMLQNYLKVALRNIRKQKFYAALNILGLALGLTASILIGLYIYDELSFDKFHEDHHNIFQVGLHIKFGGLDSHSSTSSIPLAKAMAEVIPEIDQVTRLAPRKDLVIRFEDKALLEKNVFVADPNFFEFFSFKLLEGSPESVLSGSHSVVLSEVAAHRYFGEENPIGKTISVGNENQAFLVTGVAEMSPSNSQIQFDVLLSSVSDEIMERAEWTSAGIYTYYRKSESADSKSVDSKLRSIVSLELYPMLEKDLGMSFSEFEKQGNIFALFSIPFTSSHLFYPEIVDGIATSSDIKYMYLTGAIGLFILLIACINFMNLSTARSAHRAREVGLRKAFGSARSKLVGQFLSESFVYAFAAMTIAILAAYLFLPSFNLLTGKVLVFEAIFTPSILGFILLIFITVTLLAGSYPVFYLTSFKPVEVLKGNTHSGIKSKGIRSSLVVTQFVISITLIICTLVVYTQLDYLHERNIGLDKQNVLIVQNTSRLKYNLTPFLESVTKQAGIENASYTSNLFPGTSNSGIYHTAGVARDLILPDYYADYNHLDVLKVELAEGRFFSRDFPTDAEACVINETAARELGWDNPLNEKLLNIDNKEMAVIGVVKDFNFESFKFKVKPLVINFRKASNYMLIRYNPNRSTHSEVVASIETIWKQLAPSEPFEYTFLDQNFDQLYREDQRLGKFIGAMSAIAIFVACLGLLGLAAYTAEQRTKEIGIRKVMGATVVSINSLLSRELIVLVVISFVTASALAWFAMSQWLSTFAYRIELSPMVFLLTGLAAAAIAWLTVSYHFIKAARSNPVDALRNE